MNAQAHIQQLMHADLVSAQGRNPSYSLRAFSRRIGLYSSTVSEIMNGRRRITRKMAQRILAGLGTEPLETQKLLSAVEPSRRRRKTNASTSQTPYIQIDLEQYRVVADWYHFAILSLADAEDFRDDPAWVAERLRISERDAAAALERLELVGMLERGDDRKVKATGKQFTTSADIANLSLRRHHQQNIELARRSLEEDEVLEREFTFINMAVDPKRMPEMKKRIRAFRDSFCAEFETGPRTEVFKLCLQLFPLTKSQGESQ